MALYLKHNNKNAYLKYIIKRSLKLRKLKAYNILINNLGLIFINKDSIN